MPPSPDSTARARAVARGHNGNDARLKYRWRTPPAAFQNLHNEFGFVLDAAAEPGANLCPRYLAPWGIDPTPTQLAPAGRNCLVGDWRRGLAEDEPLGFLGLLWSWFNPPWGQARTVCAPGCTKKHAHSTVDFAGTAAFVEAAIRNTRCDSQLGCVMLVPTAPDTRWWGAAFDVALQVRLCPRMAFIHPDTGKVGAAPPGSGVTLFVLGASMHTFFHERVVRADVTGKVLSRVR